MAKKTGAQLSKEIAELTKLQWQCLRRNEQYGEDCKDWNEKKRWKKEEIIISYVFNGNTDQFKESGGNVLSKS